MKILIAIAIVLTLYVCAYVLVSVLRIYAIQNTSVYYSIMLPMRYMDALIYDVGVNDGEYLYMGQENNGTRINLAKKGGAKAMNFYVKGKNVVTTIIELKIGTTVSVKFNSRLGFNRFEYTVTDVQGIAANQAVKPSP